MSSFTPAVALGRSVTVKLLGILANGSTVDVTQDASWESDNTDVAIIASPGTIQPHAMGKALITARLQGNKVSVWLTVLAAAGTSVSVTPDSGPVALGTTTQLKATETFTDGTNQDVTATATWVSSQPEVAVVSPTGLVTAKTQGNTVVTAQVGTMQAGSQLIVTPAALTSLTIAASAVQLPVGVSQQLGAIAGYSDGSTQDISSSVVWTSSQPDVAAVDDKGSIVARTIGTTTVNAALGDTTASKQLTVTPPILASLAVNNGRTELPIGVKQQLGATGVYTDGSTHDLTASVTWSSSQPEIALVSASGLVTAKAIGSATMSAQIGNNVGSGPITVTSAVLATLAVNTNRSSVPLGLTQQFTALGTYTDASTHDLTSTATWSSSQPDIATLGAGGVATTKAVGAVTVNAAVGSTTATGSLTVTPAALTSLAINGNGAAIPVGRTQQLTAQGTYTDGSTHDVTATAVWSSAQPSIASVSSAGLVTAQATGAASVNAQVGAIGATTQLSISPAALVSLAINGNGAAIPVGRTQQLTAQGTYTDGSTHDVTATAVWSSAQPSIASVNSAGLVTAQATGAASVNAQVGAIGATTQLSISPAALVSLAINGNGAAIPVGRTQQLTAQGTYTDGSTHDVTATAVWSSAQPRIASVSSAGLVTAQATGAASVRAQVGAIGATTQLTVSPAALVSLAVSPDSSFLPLGLTQQFSARGIYSDGATSDLSNSVSWSSTPSGVASVTSSGIAKGVGLGFATVQARSGSVTGSAGVQIGAPVLLAVSVSSPQLVMPLGTSQSGSAQGQFSDGSTQDLTNSVIWSSDSPGILSVSGDGVMQAQGVGSATVSAVSTSSGLSGSLQMSVTPPALTYISILPNAPATPIGSSLQLSAIGSYTDGSSQDLTSSVAWTIDSANVAQVTDSGIVIGTKVGSANVGASLNDVVASSALVVQPVALTGYFTADSSLPDTTVRVSNSGTNGSTLCAMVYVFDQRQQMTECCGCTVSPDGLRTVSVKTDLNDNPLTGIRSTTGSIALVPAQYDNGTCDPASMTPDGFEVAWGTHIYGTSRTQVGHSETPFSTSTLSDALSVALQAQCQFIQQLGSGQGICRCGSE